MDEKKIGKLRQNAHPNGTERYYNDPNREDTIGVAGEFAFGKRYNLQVDERILPEGDGHVDFRIKFNERIITFDIKTAMKAYNLLVKEWEIEKCADVLVLAEYIEDDFQQASDLVDSNQSKKVEISFLGWASRKTMALQPKKVFSSLNILNYYLHFTQLNPMDRLDNFFYDNANAITQIIED